MDDALRVELLRRMEKDQVYGTQVTQRNGVWMARDLSDPGGVDERRAAAGLGTLEEYLRGFDDYPVPTPRMHCHGCDAWIAFEPPEDDEPLTVTCPECGQQATVTSIR
jgi:hypothetical protein